MNNIELLEFSNIGFLITQLSENELIFVKNEINEIKSDFEKAIPMNYNLAGNIKKEFRLIKNIQYLDNLIQPYISNYENKYGYFQKINLLSKPAFLRLEDTWVNFQAKHEFNPIHNHDGVYSFVIWIDIPYDIENEKNYSPGSASNTNIAGQFQFIINNALGEIDTLEIPTDKTYNNKLMIFPSKMYHAVYPFFTSDEYRISVSGNFKILNF